MTIARIYQQVDLSEGALVTLDDVASHHLARVLRAKIQDPVTVFNGSGGEYASVIETITKKSVTLRINKFNAREAESPLNLYLAQGIARGEKMDYIIQKAVELGVKKIIPLLTERSTVKLAQDRREKRWQHWQSIIISACEQCGRNRLPELAPVQNFRDWVSAAQADQCFVLAPLSTSKLRDYQVKPSASVILLIGPEGGLSEPEINAALTRQFSALNLGPRILRTETAAVAALSALQCSFGDMV
ncbi:MAG: 16S rRNA (uracil(1498)-N(3))-methyltransferase [Pseudomonadota bacterium]